jgi:hypothetical protein
MDAANYLFRIDSMHIDSTRADTDHSDTDYLVLVVKIDGQLYHLERRIGYLLHNGDDITLDDNFQLGPLSVPFPDSVVTIGLSIVNLGSSDYAEQMSGFLKAAGSVVSTVGAIDPDTESKAVIVAIGTALSTVGTVEGWFAGPSFDGQVLIDNGANSNSQMDRMELLGNLFFMEES